MWSVQVVYIENKSSAVLAFCVCATAIYFSPSRSCYGVAIFVCRFVSPVFFVVVALLDFACVIFGGFSFFIREHFRCASHLTCWFFAFSLHLYVACFRYRKTDISELKCAPQILSNMAQCLSVRTAVPLVWYVFFSLLLFLFFLSSLAAQIQTNAKWIKIDNGWCMFVWSLASNVLIVSDAHSIYYWLLKAIPVIDLFTDFSVLKTSFQMDCT